MRVQIWQLFTVKVWELALADGLMVLNTAVSLPLHRLIRSQIGAKLGLRWQGGGMAVQSIFQLVWFAFWVA
jgi:sterol O-acyltransferase